MTPLCQHSANATVHKAFASTIRCEQKTYIHFLDVHREGVEEASRRERLPSKAATEAALTVLERTRNAARHGAACPGIASPCVGPP